MHPVSISCAAVARNGFQYSSAFTTTCVAATYILERVATRDSGCRWRDPLSQQQRFIGAPLKSGRPAPGGLRATLPLRVAEGLPTILPKRAATSHNAVF